MQLCSLSVAYACPYHKPMAIFGTLFTTLISANRSPTQCHTRCLPSARLKPGSICEEHTSPACQWPSKVSICPLKSVTMPNCSQIKTLVRTTSTQMSFHETVSDSLCRNSSVGQTTISSYGQGLISDDPAGEEAGCGGPGLEWLHLVSGCEAGWTYCQILENNVLGGLW